MTIPLSQLNEMSQNGSQIIHTQRPKPVPVQQHVTRCHMMPLNNFSMICSISTPFPFASIFWEHSFVARLVWDPWQTCRASQPGTATFNHNVCVNKLSLQVSAGFVFVVAPFEVLGFSNL